MVRKLQQVQIQQMPIQTEMALQITLKYLTVPTRMIHVHLYLRVKQQHQAPHGTTLTAMEMDLQTVKNQLLEVTQVIHVVQLLNPHHALSQ